MVVRTGLWNNGLLTLFPTGGENTGTSPTLLAAGKFARSMVNLVPNRRKAGSGTPRFGMGALGPAAPADILDGWEFVRQDGSSFAVTYHADGVLRSFDGTSYTDIRTGLATNGQMFAVQFNNKLIFCNGIDPNFSYNGVTIVDLGEYVTDYSGDGTPSGYAYGASSNPEWVSSSSISLVPTPGRDDYPVGRSVRITFGTTGPVTAEVQSTSLVGGTLTITVVGTPFPSADEPIKRVEYFDKPPPFSLLYTKHNLLWALTGGEVRARVNRPGDGMKVYYTTANNNENAWFSQGTLTSTQNVAFISLRNQSRTFDELVGISDLDDNMVFHGRLNLHLYSGYDPNTIGGFVFVKSIPVGTVSGKHIQRIPSDISFVSPSGIVSLRRVFTTEAPEVLSDIGSAVDPTIDDKLLTLNSEDATYRRGRSWYYQRGGLLAFKLDGMNLMVYVLSEQAKGWTEFSGYFTDAACFLPLADGRLLIGRGSQMYAYANGTDPLVGIAYTDGGEPITCTWWTPWLSNRGGRWGNRAYKFLLESASTVMFTIDRMIDFDETNVITSQVSVVSTGAKWGESLWGESLWGGRTEMPLVSDKFLCDEAFALRISFVAPAEGFGLLGFRPIGR